MKKVILTLSFIFFVLSSRLVLAVTVTPTKTPTPSPTTDLASVPVATSGAIMDDINARIKNAIDKNLKTTQTTLGDSVNSSLLVGYSGTIGDIKQAVFNLTTDDNTLQVSYATNAAIIKDGKPLKAEMLSLKDQAIVIGNLTTPDILTAKRIVITTPSGNPILDKKTILAPIIKIKGAVITLKIDNQNQDVVLSKTLKLDLKTLTTANKIFGIIIPNLEPSGPATLLQAKIL